MKVALCLSGQPRFIEKAFPFIQNCLILPNNADVFFHTWFDESFVGKRFVSNRNGIPLNDDGGCFHADTVELLKRLYSPKAFEISAPLTFCDSLLPVDCILSTHAGTYTRPEFVSMIYSSWYSIQRSNSLKELYRLQNGINYDFVIRARFDASLNLSIPCNLLSKGCLYVDNRELPPNMISDWFAISSNDVSNVYASGFNALERFANNPSQNDLICGENIVFRLMSLYNIPVIKINELTHHPIRFS
jgi:hypothetical protein